MNDNDENHDPNEYVCKTSDNLHPSCRFSWSYKAIINGYVAIGLKSKVKWPDVVTNVTTNVKLTCAQHLYPTFAGHQ